MRIKNQRLLTKRYDNGSYEAIEKNTLGYFFWVGEDKACGCVFSFPCEEWFVKEKFEEMGRTYDNQR